MYYGHKFDSRVEGSEAGRVYDHPPVRGKLVRACAILAVALLKHGRPARLHDATLAELRKPTSPAQDVRADLGCLRMVLEGKDAQVRNVARPCKLLECHVEGLVS